MASPEQLQEARNIEAQQALLQQEYANMPDKVRDDLFKLLNDGYDQALACAFAEKDLTEKALYLQTASDYDTIRLYLRDKLATVASS